MILNISESGGAAMLNALSDLMDGGSIELLSPQGLLLVTLKLSSPATGHAVGGEVAFNTIMEGSAVLSGQAATARVLAADGDEVFSCDVGSMHSDAVVKLSTTNIHHSGPVKINEFRLAMP